MLLPVHVRITTDLYTLMCIMGCYTVLYSHCKPEKIDILFKQFHFKHFSYLNHFYYGKFVLFTITPSY